MLTRMIDDIKDSAGVAIRMPSLAAAVALGFLCTIAFLCAAAFVYVLQNYGPVEACLTGAGIFFVIALIGIGVYVVRKNHARQEAKETAKSALHTALADPVIIAPALQGVRHTGSNRWA